MNGSTLTDLIDRIEQAARAGGVSELDLMTLRLVVLDGHSLKTLQTARRVIEIERSLTGATARDRAAIVCERLGIKRRWYFDLKKLASAAHDCTIHR